MSWTAVYSLTDNAFLAQAEFLIEEGWRYDDLTPYVWRCIHGRPDEEIDVDPKVILFMKAITIGIGIHVVREREQAPPRRSADYLSTDAVKERLAAIATAETDSNS